MQRCSKCYITKNSSRPLAAQFFFKGHLLSKFSVLAEVIVYLPAATEFGVIFQMDNYCCFKCRPIDKRLLEMLIQSEMYFPHRAQLNDPFDCNIDIVRAIDHAISHGACKNPENLQKFRDDETVTKRFTRNVGDMDIGSFALVNDETLLWSHYENDHKGVVLRYEFSEQLLNDEENILGVSAVSYKPNAVSDWLSENAHLYSENHQEFIVGLLKKVLMSKAPAWSYEKEARIVRPVSGVFSLPRGNYSAYFQSHYIFSSEGISAAPSNASLNALKA